VSKAGTTIPSSRGVRIRAALDDLPRYSPGRGGGSERGVGGSVGRLARLAQNEDSHGPFESALEAIAAEARSAHRYPDSGSGVLRAAIADFHDVPGERVFVAAGSSAVIHYLSLALLEPGDEVVYCAPTFPAYRLEALKIGARPIAVPLRDDGAYDLDGLVAAATDRTRIAYVTNPNNPTGVMVPRAELERFLDQLPEHILPVVDEAYFEYVADQRYPDGIAEFARRGRPVVVLRTFSKAYGLAGLRVGYCVCPAEIATALIKLQVQFEVSRIAAAAALASLQDAGNELVARIGLIRAQRDRVIAELSARGLAPLSSVANFVQFAVGDAATLARKLESCGVLVRPLGSWGVPTAIRVTIAGHEDMTCFLDALSAVSSPGRPESVVTRI
jgi:histidinol-phosphate aminotransferase